jgi:hypothetical protein
VRPAGGAIYGLGSTGRLYQLNRTTGAATAVGSAPFAVALSGTEFGFDFNPTVDRIRITSDAEQNLRAHPDMGTVVDGDPGTAGIQGDAALNPAGSVGAVAYTNSVMGAMATTLYGIDAAANTLVRIGGVDGTPSPNAGMVTPIGALGVDGSAPVGFDIAPGSNTAYAVLQIAGASKLYTVNLATGAATEVGAVGGATPVRAIAVLP